MDRFDRRAARYPVGLGVAEEFRLHATSGAFLAFLLVDLGEPIHLVERGLLAQRLGEFVEMSVLSLRDLAHNHLRLVGGFCLKRRIRFGEHVLAFAPGHFARWGVVVCQKTLGKIRWEHLAVGSNGDTEDMALWMGLAFLKGEQGKWPAGKRVPAHRDAGGKLVARGFQRQFA